MARNLRTAQKRRLPVAADDRAETLSNASRGGIRDTRSWPCRFGVLQNQTIRRRRSVHSEDSAQTPVQAAHCPAGLIRTRCHPRRALTLQASW